MKRCITISAILFFALLLGAPVAGQLPIVQNFTTSDGLPSSTIFDIMQDETGYVWLATNNGLSRYNGLEFENFSTDDGLPDLDMIHFAEGRGDTVWCMGYNGSMAILVNGKITVDTGLNNLLTANFTAYMDKVYRDTLGYLWVAPRFGGLYKVDHDYNLMEVYGDDFSGGYSYIYFRDFGEGYIMAIIEPPEGLKSELPEFYHDGDSYFIRIKSVVPHLHRNFIRKGEGDYILSYYKHIYRINGGEIVKTRKSELRIIDIECDHQNNLWICYFTAGVQKFRNCNFDREPETYFEGLTVSRSFQDAERIMWFSTTNEGLYRINSFKYGVYSKSGGSTRYTVTSLAAGGGKVFFTSYNQRVFFVDVNKQKERLNRLPIFPVETNFYDLLIEGDTALWLLNSEYYKYTLSGEPMVGNEIVPGLIIEPLSNGRFLTTSQLGVYIWANGQLAGHSRQRTGSRILSAIEDNERDIWLGTLRGLYQYNDGEVMKYSKYPELEDAKITALGTAGRALVIGRDQGELLFLSEDTLQRIEPKTDRYFGNINRICEENDSLIWVATDAGLVRLLIEKTAPLSYNLRTYQTGDGLSSNKINDLLIYDDKLWLGTNRGLMVFRERNEPRSLLLPKVVITGFFVNNREIDQDGKMVFGPDENNIRIEFQGISQKGGNNIHYRYKLFDHDPQRVFTGNLYANFPNLDPGDYTFFVNAGDKDGNWNEVPESISFSIERHFTDTALFYVLIALAVLLLIGFILYVIIRSEKRKAALQQNLVLMQQRLLRSQMNPHFVFNSLLAIQAFIYKSNPKEAGRYLSRFARLIRMILNSSRKELIPLEEELSYLEYYLDLQKLRFKDAFDYKIEVAEDIHPDRIMLPPLLAQPFIENAIEHGLRSLDHKGEIIIRFKCEKATLVFQVQDNGIGISEAEKLKYDKGAPYESLGQKITVDRLRLLNKMHGQMVTFNIEERKSMEGKIMGTLVSFHIKYSDEMVCK
jgi:hypothetical protein